MRILPEEMTIGEAYSPAMEMVDQFEADEYFEALVRRCMGHGRSREEAESIERQSLGYFAGYYGNQTVPEQRIERNGEISLKEVPVATRWLAWKQRIDAEGDLTKLVACNEAFTDELRALARVKV